MSDQENVAKTELEEVQHDSATPADTDEDRAAQAKKKKNKKKKKKTLSTESNLAEASSDETKLSEAEEREREALLKAMMGLRMPRQTVAAKDQHTFWGTQPVLNFGTALPARLALLLLS